MAKSMKDYQMLPRQEIKIFRIPDGEIIDIGGGGEGIIAQIGRNKVTTIDKLQSEIEEARPKAPDANWICADATNLDFPNASFDNTTFFFSGMFMSMDTLTKVLYETFRLIKDGGELWYWDAVIDYDIGPFIIPLKIILPNQHVVETGYGRPRVRKSRTVDNVIKLLKEIGFIIDNIESSKYWYFIKCHK